MSKNPPHPLLKTSSMPIMDITKSSNGDDELANQLSKVIGDLTRKDVEIANLRADLSKAFESRNLQRSSSELQLQELHSKTSQQEALLKTLREEHEAFGTMKQELEERIETLVAEKMAAMREVRKLKSDLEIAKNNMEAMERDLEKSQKLVEQERRRAQYDSSKSVYEAKMAMVTETENRLREDLRAAEQAVTEQARKYELEVSTLKTEVISAKQAEATAIAERSTLEEQRLTFQSEIRRLNALISTLRTDLLESTNIKDELEYRMESTSTEYTTIKKQFSEMQDELNSYQDKCTSLQNQLISKDNDFESMKTQFESTIHNYEQNTSSYSEIESKLKFENQQLEKDYRELNSKMQALESTHTSLKYEIEAKHNEYITKCELLTTYETNNLKLSMELQSLQAALELERSKGTKLSVELEQSRSTSSQQNNNFQETERNLRFHISKLEASNQDVTVKLKNYENEISTLKQQMLQIQASESEVVIEYKSKLSQLSQEFDDLQRSHTNIEGNLKIEKMHLEELKRTHDNQTEIIRSDRQRLEQEISNLHSKLQLQQDKYSALEQEADRLRFSLDSTKTNIGSIQSESERKYEILSLEHNECLRHYETDKSEWKASMSKLSLQLSALSDSESRLKLDIKRLELLNNDLTRKCEEESSRFSRLQVAYDDLRISRNSAVDASRDSDNDHRRQHFAETERLKTQLENYRNQVTELNRKKSEMESRLELSKSEHHTLLKSSKSEIETLKKRIQILEVEKSVPSIGLAERVTTELVFQTEIKRLELTIEQLENEVKALSNSRHEMNFSQSSNMQINGGDISSTNATTTIQNFTISSTITTLPKEQEYIRNIELSNQQLLQSEQLIQTLQQDLLLAKKTINTINEQKAQLKENYEERISSLKSEVQNLQLFDEDFPKNLYSTKASITTTTTSGTNIYNSSIASNYASQENTSDADLERLNQRLEREIKRLKTLLLFHQQDHQIITAGRSEESSRMLALESENAAIRSDLCILRGQLELSNNRAEVLKDFNSKIDNENSRSKKIIKTLRNQLVTSLQVANPMDNKKSLASATTTTSISFNTYKSSSTNGLYKSTSFPDLLNRQFDESAVAHRKQPKSILSQTSQEFPYDDPNEELISRIESLLAEKAFDRAELYAMEGQLAAIKAADRSLRAELERSRDRYTCQENAIVVYEEQIQELEDELLLKTNSLKSEFSNNSSDFSVFSNQLVREDQIKELENEVNLLQQSLVVMKKENQAEKDTNNMLQLELKLLQEFKASQCIDNNSTPTANSSTNANNYQLKVSQFEIESQNLIINQYKDTIDRLNEEIKTNTETIKELNTKITNNQKQFEKLSSDHTSLLSKKNKTADTIKKLNNEISESTNKLTKITEQNNKLTSELRTLKETHIRLQDTYSKSQSTQSQLQLQLTNSERVKLDLESKLMNLQTTQTLAMNDEIETSRSELEACHHKLAALEREVTYKTSAWEKSKKQSDAVKLSLELRVRELSESESRLRSSLARSEVALSELNDRLRGLDSENLGNTTNNISSGNDGSNSSSRTRASFDNGNTYNTSDLGDRDGGSGDSSNGNNNSNNTLQRSLQLEQSRNAKLTADLNISQIKMQSLTDELHELQTESQSQSLSDRNEIDRLQAINKKLIDQFSFSDNSLPTNATDNIYDINNFQKTPWSTSSTNTTNGYVSIGNNIKTIGEVYVLRGREKSLQLEILLLKKENSELKENISNAVMHRDREEKRVTTPECFRTPRTTNKSMSKLSIMTPLYEGDDRDGPWTMTTTNLALESPFDARSTSAFGSPTPSTMTPIGSQIRRLQNKLEEQNDELQLQQEQIAALQTENTILKSTKSELEKTLGTQLNAFSIRISTETTKISKLYGLLFISKRDKEVFHSDIARLNRVIFELKEDINNHKTQIMHLEEENQQLRSNTDSKMLINELQAKIVSLEQQIRGIIEIQWGLETKVLTSENTITSLRLSENALRLKLGESQQTVLRLESRLKEMEQEEEERHRRESLEREREINALTNEAVVLRSQILDLESSTTLLTRRLEMVTDCRKRLEEGAASTEREHRLKLESWSQLQATLETDKYRLQSELNMSRQTEQSLRDNLLRLESEMTELRRLKMELNESSSNNNSRYQREMKSLRQSYEMVCEELRRARLEQSNLIAYLEGSARSLKRRVDEWEKGLDASYPETVRLRAELTSWEQDFDSNKSRFSNFSQMSETGSSVEEAVAPPAGEGGEGGGRRGGSTVDESQVKALMNALLNMKEELCRVLTQRTILESDNYKLQTELRVLKQDARQRGKDMNFEGELEYKSSEIALLKESEEILKNKLLSGDLERNELITKVNYLQNKLVATSEKLVTIERQYKLSLTELKQERETREAKRESELRWDELKIKLATAELAVTKSREDVATVQGRLSALSQKLAESQSRRRQLETEKEELSTSHTRLTEQLKLKDNAEQTLKLELQVAVERQAAFEESLSDLRVDRRVCEDRLEALNKENEELADKIQSLVEERREAWSKIQTYSDEVAVLRQRVSSEGGLGGERSSSSKEGTINALRNQILTLEEEKSLLIFTIDELRAALRSSDGFLKQPKVTSTTSYLTSNDKFNLRDIMLSNEDTFTKLQRAYERIIYLEEERERILSRYNRMAVTRKSMDLNASDELLLIQDSHDISAIPGLDSGVKSVLSASGTSASPSKYKEMRSAQQQSINTPVYHRRDKEDRQPTRRESSPLINEPLSLHQPHSHPHSSALPGPKQSPMSPEREREHHSYTSSKHPPLNPSHSRGSSRSSNRKETRPSYQPSVTSSLDSFVLYNNNPMTAISTLTSSKSTKKMQQLSRQNKSDDQHALIDAIRRKDELLRRREAELLHREREIRSSKEAILRTKLAAEEQFRNATEIAEETELRTNKLVTCVEAMRDVHNKLSEEANKKQLNS